jgi:tRNA A-37 threonylcarbamoyl transferase component Bud32
MVHESAGNINGTEVPSPDRLMLAIRRNLQLGPTVPISLVEKSEFSNINFVYRVEIPSRCFYLKVVPERPRNFPVHVPRERVFSEAEGIRRFRDLAKGIVTIPEVLFVDREEMALAMSDVGEGRHVLFSILGERFDLIVEQAEALGTALGKIHGGTRGADSLRPPHEEFIVRKIVFDGLLGPGAQLVFPELWPEVNAEMQTHRECLVHGDLWSKNLLVKEGEPIGIVDFEGVHYGDPAFDLATLISVSLLPAVESPWLLPRALDFAARLLYSWSAACGSDEWPASVLPRVFRATGTFLAARGFGPFAYVLSETAKGRIAMLAKSLAAEPPASFDAFRSRAAQFLDAAIVVEP